VSFGTQAAVSLERKADKQVNHLKDGNSDKGVIRFLLNLTTTGVVAVARKNWLDDITCHQTRQSRSCIRMVFMGSMESLNCCFCLLPFAQVLSNILQNILEGYFLKKSITSLTQVGVFSSLKFSAITEMYFNAKSSFIFSSENKFSISQCLKL
jgi:hypothetical protein